MSNNNDTGIDIKLWDSIKIEEPKPTFVPDGNDLTAVIKSAKVHVKEETGYHGIMFELYFPAFNLTEKSFDSIKNDEAALTRIKAKFDRLGISHLLSGTDGSLQVLNDVLAVTEGWTIKVTKKSTKQKIGDGYFRNYYFNSVISKDTPIVKNEVPSQDVPF